MKARLYNLAVWVSSLGILVAGWFLLSSARAGAGGTTPIGSAKELLPYTSGHADCPFAVTYGGRVVGALYCDGGGAGGFAPSSELWAEMPDAGGIYSLTTLPAMLTNTGDLQAYGNITGVVGIFSNSVIAGAGGVSNVTALLKLKGSTADGATAVSVAVDSPSYTTAGAKLLSIRNNGIEKASIDKDGAGSFATLNASGSANIGGSVLASSAVRSGTSLPTCGSSIEGALVTKVGASSTPTKLCICRSDGAGSPTYQWCSLTITASASPVCTGGSTTVCP